MSPRAQKMKTGPDALSIVGNESGCAKHENGTGLPQYRRKQVREHEYENRTRRPRYLRKRVRVRKT
jgi:hypothetical protein